MKLFNLLGKLIPYYSITSINYLYLIPNMLCKYLLHRIILQNCSCMPIFVAQYFSLAKGYYFDTAVCQYGMKYFLKEHSYLFMNILTSFNMCLCKSQFRIRDISFHLSLKDVSSFLFALLSSTKKLVNVFQKQCPLFIVALSDKFYLKKFEKDFDLL